MSDAVANAYAVAAIAIMIAMFWVWFSRGNGRF